MRAYGVFPVLQQVPRKQKHILCVSCWDSIFSDPVPNERLVNHGDVAAAATVKGKGALWCWNCQRHVMP
jgi:hypothetical protein